MAISLQIAIVLSLCHERNGIVPKDPLGINNWSAHYLIRITRLGLSRLD